MTHLLDVNVLLALLDPDHVFSDQANSWFERHAAAGCDLPNHGERRRADSWESALSQRAGNARCRCRYAWEGTPPARTSILAGRDQSLSSTHIRPASLGSYRQVTDTYLLALAVHNSGRLASFDRRLSAAAVAGGSEALHIVA